VIRTESWRTLRA